MSFFFALVDVVRIYTVRISSSMAQANNILFYSPKCKYSNEVTKMIEDQGLLKQFYFINILSTTVKLPPFVDRVPLIFIRKKNEIVIEQNIPLFIKSLTSGGVAKQAAAPSSGLIHDPQAMNNFGNYSFIDGGADVQQSLQYQFINDDVVTPIETVPSTSANGLKENKFDSKQYDDYMAQRDLDVASIFPRQNRT